MSLTRKDIENYKSSSEDSYKNAIEQKTIDDGFESDALEGWNDPSVSVTHLKNLDSHFIKKSLLNVSLYIGVFCVIIIGAISLLIYSGKPEPKIANAKNEIKAEKSTNFKLSKDTIEAFESLPVKKQIQAITLKNNFKKQIEEKVEIQEETPDLTMSPLPIKKVNAIGENNQVRINLAKETYLQDLLVVDYRYYRKRPEKPNSEDLLTGTPAENELGNDNSEESLSIVEVSYMNFLEKTLKYFNQNKHKLALQRFELILETYPDDVNALFYSALCLYNLNQFQLCEQRLMHLQNARFTNFDEEMNWYLLLTYRAQNKTEAFQKIKEQIVARKGFYSKQAEKL